MPESLTDLVARLKAAQPALADVPDDVLTAEVLTQLQARGGPSVGDALDAPTFRTTNEKDAGGAAVVRDAPPLGFLAPYLEHGMDLLRGVTGLGDQGPAGPTWTNAGALLAALPVVAGVKRVATVAREGMPAVEEALQGIRAYHGSPHDFEAFSTARIGTGEGAQAYGHGLYFAEKEGTAKAYRDQLADAGKVVLYGQEYPVPPWRGDMDPHTRLVRHLGDARSLSSLRDVPDADIVAHVRRNILDEIANPFADKVAAQRELELLDRAAAHPAGIITKPGGKMYEVQIKADPAHFLDWDKPLSAQSPQVQQAVQRMRDAGVLGDETGAVTTGAELLRSKSVLAPEHNLKQAGVPGIKYLDQGSRGTAGGELIDVFKGPEGWQSKIRMNRANGEQYFTTSAPHATRDAAEAWAQQKIADPGTRNYVVFDDTLIDILRKYGLVPPLAAAAAGRLVPDHTRE